ncbi:hypothetical protein MLGJGCBP_01722 [Rhodococcus sp. T7]|nr:hypothetical protein MLGJGCBP_09117 [Rhodococcus sp. T7]KAF0965122.1 hypothetical protein MLGJGCBP_01722 [Rhodococcus sp. T7]
MFTIHRALGVTLVAASLTLAPLFGTTPQAVAEPTVHSFQIPLVWSTGLFTGCGPILNLCASTPTAIAGERPGTVTFPVISPNSEGTYWMHWRNLATGAAGVLTVPYNESASAFTGAGPVTASMTTGQEIIAGTGMFWVP